MHKIKIAKIVLLGLVWFTGFLDIISLVGVDLRFETNPIYVLTQSFLILILWKILILSVFSWAVWKLSESRHNWVRYYISFMLLSFIVLQFFGFQSNMVGKEFTETTSFERRTELVSTPQQNVDFYVGWEIKNLLMPLLSGLGAFLIYDKVFKVG